MNRLIRAALRATWPVHRPIDEIASRFVGRGSLLVLVAHFYGEGDGWTRLQIREQLARVRARCALLSLSEARRRLREGTLPSRAAVLFVDDGADTFYEAGYPILRELEIPFVLSIIPGLIPADDRTHFLARLMRVAGLEYERSPRQINDAYRRVTGADASISDHASLFDAARNVSLDRIRDLIDVLEIPDDRFMTWERIQRMLAESRSELANHSMSHPLMRRVRDDWMDFEIVQSRSRIEDRTGCSVPDFVFPVGSADDATPAVIECLERNDYRAAYLVGMGLMRGCGQFLVPRAPLEVTPTLVHVATSHAANSIAGRISPVPRVPGAS